MLTNYETLLIDNLENFSQIFLDEFVLLKKKLILIKIIMIIIYILIYILCFYLQYKIIQKIFDEQERATDIFFKINPEYLITAIKNCEIFIELNQKDKTNPEYLVSNPLINLSQNDINEFSSSFSDLETSNLLTKNFQKEFKIRKNTSIKKKIDKCCDMKKIDKFYIISYSCFIIIILIILFYIIIIQLISYQHIYNLSELYFLILNQRTYLIKYYNYLRTILCYYGFRYSIGLINKIYFFLKNDFKTVFHSNQLMFKTIYESFKKVNKNEKILFDKLINNNICEYINEFSKHYKVSCDEYADGISRYGIYSSSIYAYQIILYLFFELDNILNQLEIKGYKYNEVIQRSDIFNINFYPNDSSLWDDYKSLNPILLLNNQKTHDLVILIQQIIQGASSYLSSYYKKKMLNIVDYIKIRIIFCQFFFYFLLVVACYFFLIPRILKKNEEMMEERNMLNIIPKNELEQILIKEDIRI